MIKPPRLKPGGTIGVVSPSSPPEKEFVDQARQRLEAMGFRVVYGQHIFDRRGYLAGTDQDRANDLVSMLVSPDVDAVIAARGGYGSGRIIPLIDWELVAAHPKPFVGFSDITALHLAFGRFLGWVTFQGAMLETLGRRQRDVSWESLLDALTRPEPLGGIYNPANGSPVLTIVPGKARGLLTGGNLSLLAASIGTPYAVQAEGRILLIEDVDEAPYRIDRMLNQLKQAGVLDAAVGFVIGECIRCRDDRAEQNTLTLAEVLDDYFVPLGKPTIYGLAVGHGDEILTVPFGVMAQVDADNGRLLIEETATS